MVKVRATNNSKKNNIKVKELGRLAVEGEEFEVTDERAKVLLGENTYGLKFVEVVVEEQAKVVETSSVEVPAEPKKPRKKRTTKKKVEEGE